MSSSYSPTFSLPTKHLKNLKINSDHTAMELLDWDPFKFKY